MKKLSAILLAVALVVMACVPFCASAEEPAGTVTFKVEKSEVVDGQFTLFLNYEMTGMQVLGATVDLGYDASKVEIASMVDEEGVTLPPFMDNHLVNEESEAVVYKATGTAVISDSSSYENGINMQIAKATPFKDSEGTMLEVLMNVKDENVTAADFKVKVSTWLVADKKDPTTIYKVISEDAPQEETYTLSFETKSSEEPTPIETTTEAPNPTTEAPTTKAPNKTGEATPWALMATVAVAGAALVVLATKKSK